jgi:choline dehydrogenase-like flavoprotein
MNAPHRIAQPTNIECDILVIGSGAGGAVVADVLTRAGLDVVMVEEGPYRDRDFAPATMSGAFAEMWRAGGMTVALGRPPISYAEGCCVGGGTEINSAIFQRAPEALLDAWRDRYRLADFGAAALAPYYDRAAQVVNATVARSRPFGEASEIMKRGASALGWQLTTLERGVRQCVGTNFCSFGCPTGGKQSMTATLIPDSLARGLRLIADCRVTRICQRRKQVTGAVGIATGPDGRRHRVRIRARQVFLCAGATQSPALLLRSGLASARIGKSLRMHPTIKVVALFDHEVAAHEGPLPAYAVTEFMPDQRLGGSLFQPSLFGLALAEDWDARSWMLPHWRRSGLYYAMARGTGIGSVRSLPGRSNVMVRFALSREDWKNLCLGLARLGRLMFAAGARCVYPSIAHHPGWKTAEGCDEFADRPLPAAETNLMTIHLFSSIPPGEDTAHSATDSFGRVRGIANLIVADASQIPEAPGVNPQATVMALAFRAAEAFLATGGARMRHVAATD